jgi:signal transduction histidine kinase
MNVSENISRRILVVEDDAGDFGLVRAHIRLAGLNPEGGPDALVWAKNLAEGIAAASRQKPSVILLDLSLPDSAGLDTVRAMRAAQSDVPIVVLTGNEDTSLALAAMEAGAQDYLVKGQFEHDALGRAVRHAQVREKLEQELVQHKLQLEDTVAERTQELLLALKSSEAANRAKSAFLANMSHELRTPMNGILGLAGMLSADAANPQQLDRLVRLERTARHLMDVLNDILDISSIEAGKMTLDVAGFQPAVLLQEVYAAMAPQAQGKALALQLDAGIDLPAWVLGDASRLRQILINLVGNAVEFTGHGSITLGARVEARDSASVLLRFSVVDTGVGIAAEDQERIFSPFEQVDNSLTREHGGTGLGLALCRNFAGLMGSRIELRSAPGQGSTFSFAVRLQLDTRGAKLPVQAAAAERPVSLDGVRILVAEDDELSQEIILGLLEAQAVQVELATDGWAAVELAGRKRYDLILMDLHMPVMDGFEASVRIRAMPDYRTTPIIALTSDEFSTVCDACQQAGMNDHVSKPFDSDQLCAVIGKWLRKSGTS